MRVEREQREREEAERQKRKKEEIEKNRKEAEEREQQRLEKEKLEQEEKIKAQKEFEGQLPKNWKQFIPNQFMDNLHDDDLDAIMLNEALKLSEKEKEQQPLFVDLESQQKQNVNYKTLEKSIEELSEEDQLALALQLSLQ